MRKRRKVIRIDDVRLSEDMPEGLDMHAYPTWKDSENNLKLLIPSRRPDHRG